MLATIKKKWPDIICILMSNNSCNEEAAKALNLEGYLSKPFGIKDLFDIVQRFVVATHRGIVGPESRIPVWAGLVTNTPSQLNGDRLLPSVSLEPTFFPPDKKSE